MRKELRFAMATMLLMALCACQAFNVPAPKDFNDKMAIAITSVTTARNTGATLLQAKKISVTDAENVQAQANNFRAGLDIARTIHATDPASGTARLDAISAGLTALQTYLDGRKK